VTRCFCSKCARPTPFDSLWLTRLTDQGKLQSETRILCPPCADVVTAAVVNRQEVTS
jgi:RNase P subunit RPR2